MPIKKPENVRRSKRLKSTSQNPTTSQQSEERSYERLETLEEALYEFARTFPPFIDMKQNACRVGTHRGEAFLKLLVSFAVCKAGFMSFGTEVGKDVRKTSASHKKVRYADVACVTSDNQAMILELKFHDGKHIKEAKAKLEEYIEIFKQNLKNFERFILVYIVTHDDKSIESACCEIDLENLNITD